MEEFDLLTRNATIVNGSGKETCGGIKFLGHASLQHTRKYVVLERALSGSGSEDFVCKVAKSVEEVIELGFEFVNEISGRSLYRK